MGKTKQIKNKQEKAKKTPKTPVNYSVGVRSSFKLLRESWSFLYLNKKKLLGVALVFLVLYLLMVRAGSTFDLSATEQIITDGIGSDGLFSKTLLTGVLIGSGVSAGTSVSSMSSFLLLLMGSLAFIWSIRRLEAGKSFLVRDAYYRGMYPLVPFMLVIFLISIELIPFVVGGLLYTTAEVNGIISSFVERTVFISAWIGLGLLSAYWLMNALMGLYAVTLPDAYPLQMLRSTKKVVKGRRWSIFLKILVLAIFLLLTTSLILLLTILLLPIAAVFVYDILTVLALLFIHIYLFKLYRSLI